jgi:MFS family permease
MSPDSTVNRDALTQHIQAALQTAEARSRRLRKTNTYLTFTSLLSSAVSTLIAGVTAAQGPLIGQGVEGWRLACWLAAIFGVVTTLSAGISQQFRIGERLAAGELCAGRLKALQTAMAVDSRRWDEIALEFEAVVRDSPDFAQ